MGTYGYLGGTPRQLQACNEGKLKMLSDVPKQDAGGNTLLASMHGGMHACIDNHVTV